MENGSTNIFFLGKGGVGKSTTAVLSALSVANKSKKVLLVSMDPAHNLSDIFEIKLSDKPIKIIENLSVQEVDVDFWIKSYITKIEDQLKKSYLHLTALNLLDHFNLLKYSPGIEEYGMISAYQNIIKNSSDFEYILFDMPPTALTLKFFGLPGNSIIWLEKLLKLREEIINKKEVITNIKFGKKIIESDKILNNLNKQLKYYTNLRQNLIMTKNTKINLVLNNDKLSIAESKLIRNKLDEMNIKINQFILNNMLGNDDYDKIKRGFDLDNIQFLKKSEIPLIGLNNLLKYLENFDLTFMNK